MASASLEQIFTYHPPFGDQPQRYEVIRAFGRELANTIQSLTPPSREQSVALTKVQEAVMWANAAIAIHEKPPVVASIPTIGGGMVGAGFAPATKNEPTQGGTTRTLGGEWVTANLEPVPASEVAATIKENN